MSNFNTTVHNMPQLRLSFKSKGKIWRQQCVDALDNRYKFDYNVIRSSWEHRKINIDLSNGILHMEDLQLLNNPDNVVAKFIPDKILHYDIINPKIQILLGEELKRIWDWKVLVTNANAISEKENIKKEEIFQALLEEIQNTSLSEDEFNSKINKLQDYYLFEWQDLKELWGNCILNHYMKEYNMPLMFNGGFKDGVTVAEELYHVYIRGGEPYVESINPLNIDIYMNGRNSKVEEADRIILCEYWSPGRILDEYYDVLTVLDIKKINDLTLNFSTGNVDALDNWDDRKAWTLATFSNESADVDDLFGNFVENTKFDNISNTDMNGNIRVLRVYWKSLRKIKKIKFYDLETGEEDFTFMPETYTSNTAMGEEETTFWINEAWEGTKIGNDIYVNIRPMPVQFNRLSNPSRCHFGIIGSIYNYGEGKPYSLVDRMKPFAYLYDIIHDRLNKLMARNWGILTQWDLSKKPASWSVDLWMYYAKTMGMVVVNSFNEGLTGAALGKLAGGLNNNTLAVINADFGNNIQLYINLLEYIKSEVSDVAGISKQREGLISNRETVGGVERATLQSSHITELFFAIHDDVKKRVLEAFLEVTKASLKGRNKKLEYILPDYSKILIEIDGDLFAEADYGLIVDNSNGLLELQLKLETLALAALQNQTLSFSTIMKLFMSASLAEKQRFVEIDERRIKEEQQLQILQLLLAQLQAQQAQLLALLEERLFKDAINQRDNETKIMVAEINSLAEMAILQLKNRMTEVDLLDADLKELQTKNKLMYDMEKLDKEFQLKNKLLELQQKQFQANLDFLKSKALKDQELKLKSITSKSSK